jgi:hypothetical protein
MKGGLATPRIDVVGNPLPRNNFSFSFGNLRQAIGTGVESIFIRTLLEHALPALVEWVETSAIWQNISVSQEVGHGLLRKRLLAANCMVWGSS